MESSNLPYKLLFLDMDGTTLNSQSQLTDFTLDVLKKYSNMGGQIIVVTGRTQESVTRLSYIRQLYSETRCPLSIYCNGAVITNAQGKRLSCSFLSPEIVAKLNRISVETETFMFLYPEDGSLSISVNSKSTALEAMIYNTASGLVPRSKYGPNDKFNSIKCLYILSPELRPANCTCDCANCEYYKLCAKALTCENCRAVYSAKMKKLLTALKSDPEITEHCVFYETQPMFMEVNSKGADKGNGMLKAAELLGYGSQDCLAFGNAGNDDPMLIAAGRGYAMKNSMPSTLACTKYITKYTNDENGVAHELISVCDIKV